MLKIQSRTDRGLSIDTLERIEKNLLNQSEPKL